MKMRKLKTIVSIILSLSLIPAVTLNAAGEAATGFYENFESYQAGDVPNSMQMMQGAGKISVIDTQSQKGMALFLKNENDGTFVAVSKDIAPLYSNYPICARISYMQPYVRAEDSAVLQLYSEGVLVVSIETKGNDICLKQPSGYVTLVGNYETDKFYDIAVTVDFAQSSVAVTVDSVQIVGDAAFVPLSEKTSIDSIRSYTRLYPGIVLDDISIGYVIDLSSIEIKGSDILSIPDSGEQAYVFTARGIDNKNNSYDGVSFSWSTEPSAIPGVRLVTENGGEKAKIIVSSTAAADTSFSVVCADAASSAMNERKSVTLKRGEIDKIVIVGGGVLVPNVIESENYSVKAYDTFGNELETQNITFSVVDNSSDFSITPSGVLKMTNFDTEADSVTIRATLTQNSSVYAEKKICVTDVRTHLNDIARREAVKAYMDRVINDARDIYHGTPLLANGIDKDGRHVLWDFINGDRSAMTDIGNQQALLRTMFAYSDVTGDETYSNKAEEIYRYTLDNNVYENLVYWGPHASMDLKTGKRAAGNGYHEVESKNMYLSPFFDIDPDRASAIVKQTWMGHIINWDSLWFNRHATYGKVVSEASTWGNPDRFIENPEDPFIRDHEGQSFFIAASEYIHFALELYRETGDETALLWAKRLAYKYVKAKDTETGMLPITFTSGHKAPGTIEMPPEIWELPTMPYMYQTTNYGDRAYNQFAQPLYDAGKITEEQKDKIIEAYFYEGFPWVYNSGMLEVLELAECLGLENEQDEGFDLLYQWLGSMETYLKTAYSYDANSVPPMFTCGVKISNWKQVRSGYYGSIGRVMVSTKVNSQAFLGVVEAALRSEGFPSLKSANATFWSVARNMSKSFGLGDIGDPLRGVAPELNFKTLTTDTVYLDVFVNLYKKTGADDYLKMARLIGNNICENNYSDNLFIPEDTYSMWISCHEPLALMKLDATINGVESRALNYLYESYVYLQERWIDDHGYVDETNQHSDKYTLEYTPVKVKSIRISQKEIVLKAGEKYELDVEVLPDDATSKSIYWEIDDPSVVSIDVNNCIRARAKGETYIRAVASESSVISELVKVVVE